MHASLLLLLVKNKVNHVVESVLANSIKARSKSLMLTASSTTSCALDVYRVRCAFRRASLVSSTYLGELPTGKGHIRRFFRFWRVSV